MRQGAIILAVAILLIQSRWLVWADGTSSFVGFASGPWWVWFIFGAAILEIIAPTEFRKAQADIPVEESVQIST